jgi:hypothetical protein
VCTGVREVVGTGIREGVSTVISLDADIREVLVQILGRHGCGCVIGSMGTV